jgi:hypothetical protein
MSPQSMSLSRRLPAHVAREIAVAALADPRSVQRVVAGLPTKAATRARIMRALRDRDRMVADQDQP